MKRLLSVLTIFSLILFTSCEDEALDLELQQLVNETNAAQNPTTGNPTPGNPTTGAFQVDIDGQTFVAETATASYIDGVVNITAFRNNNTEIVTITFLASSTGTYQLGISNPGAFFVNGAAYVMEAGANGFVSSLPGNMESQGEINLMTIDETNQTISGTFNFTAYREETAGNLEILEFTNGSFSNITYSGDLSDISDPDSTFFAKVEGAEFVEDAINAIEILSFSNTVAIVAVKNNGQSISVTVPNDIVPGDYTFGFPSGTDPVGLFNESDTESFLADTGTLTITVHDTATNRIEGTFNFTGTLLLDPSNAREITEGDFKVTYQ
ncbi:DUF6252 family protein [Kordia jejudonensis]|uniref:DUF6252 family protein n=1 Tax=Kordia jejudonensis TaxID=1348245 RepID=UPI0006292286|nr:DUF6252 family protein [Kordia jejudonensis]